MGAGPRYPYPKQVWSPAGGWWVNPTNWKRNTFIVGLGVAGITTLIWRYSAEREWRHTPPRGFIPSMLWAKQYTDPENFKEPKQ
ncbi:hypothetical protein BDF22DRAFT_641411 [Syncephalis plumigaleata]|nr:hypothetical protein BDF22DRAFT_641411 [Syncephalis plumigaleata]